ncbi:MAG: class I SAM-dependent methyltransferase [Elusimicrobia bacterium]|nr:class I SAM-dependent methyltransferase [Elusimicrobiota bacterium]
MKIHEYKRNYDLETTHWWFVGMRKVYISLVEKYIPRSSEGLNMILDAGCGTGVILEDLKRLGKVVGVDYSPEAVNFCKMRGHTEVICGDAVNISLSDDSFDLVTAFMLLEHVSDDVLLLKKLKKVCRPGGRIIMFTSAFNILWSEHDDASEHFRRYRIKELKEKINNQHLKILKISYFNFLLFLPYLCLILGRRFLGIFLKRNAVVPQRTLFALPELINSLLVKFLQFEGLLLNWINFPFGVNIVCIMEKEN